MEMVHTHAVRNVWGSTNHHHSRDSPAETVRQLPNTTAVELLLALAMNGKVRYHHMLLLSHRNQRGQRH
jgi:hypothetical protein